MIVVAFVTANLPFVNQRVLALIPLSGPKILAVRLAELVVFYFIAGGVGLALENQAGQITPQGWQFYAVTGALFVTFSFPGFVYRYLIKLRD